MIVALRVEVNIIAALILIILLNNKGHVGKGMLDDRLYQILLYTTLLYSLTDIAAWIIDGTSNVNLRFSLYFINILSYLFCVILPYIWTLYAEFRLFENEEKLWKINRFLAPPVIIYSLIVMSTPYTKWMFYFNEKQMYQRGSLFVLQAALSFMYMLYPTARAIIHLKEANYSTERRECYNIGGFIVLPLLGFVIQVRFYGIPAAIIATVVSELIIFINLQNKQISIDALTGLNNRGQLNRYLGIQEKKELRKENLYMLFLDIDRFKVINDTYGHKVGDQALIDMANILKKVCNKNGGFLSRYGGDEFAIVVEKQCSEDVDKIVTDIIKETAKFNERKKRNYSLSTSIGYAEYGTEETKTVDKLIEAADSKMYEIKMKRHEEQSLKAAIN